MQDLAVLTPPLLVCAAVIVAIIVFLRHEMGRSGPDESATGDETPASASSARAEIDSEEHGDAHAPQPTRADRPAG
jgi:hypothetical protein